MLRTPLIPTREAAPKLKERLAASGTYPRTSGSEEFAAYIWRKVAKLGEVVRKASVKADRCVKGALTVVTALALHPAHVWSQTLIVSPGSEFLSGLYRERVDSDWSRTLVIRETLAIAGDREGAAALDRHLQAVVLSRLAAQLGPAPGTVKEVIGNQRDTATTLARLRAQVLATSLRPRHLAPGDEPKLPSDYKHEGEAVWSSGAVPGGNPFWIHLLIAVENTSNAPISQFDATLLLTLGPGRATLELPCQKVTWPAERDLVPGSSQPYACSAQIREISTDELLRALRRVKTGSGSWELLASRINFVDPRVSLNTQRTFWLDGAAATTNARLDVQAAGCLARGSCFEEASAQLRSGQGPLHKFVFNLIFWSVIAGILALFSGRQRLMAAGVMSALFIGFWLMVLIDAFSKNSLAAILFALYGPMVVAWYLAVLWGIVLGLHLLHRRKLRRAESARKNENFV
jgi:hypothetical protein